jgi:hypothetical protein
MGVNELESGEPSERDEVVEAVVGAAYEVGNTPGAGFLERFMRWLWRGNWCSVVSPGRRRFDSR